MNTFTANFFLGGMVLAFAIGIVISVASVIIRVCSHKKISLFFVFIRFLKGFASVALIYLYIFVSMLWSPLNNSNNKSVPASLASSIFAFVELFIPIFIFSAVHKVTKKIENQHEHSSARDVE